MNISATPLLIQLPAIVLGTAVEDGSTAWTPATHFETQMGFQAPGFRLTQPWLLQPFGWAFVDGESLLLFLLLSL